MLLKEIITATVRLLQSKACLGSSTSSSSSRLSSLELSAALLNTLGLDSDDDAPPKKADLAPLFFDGIIKPYL